MKALCLAVCLFMMMGIFGSFLQPGKDTDRKDDIRVYSTYQDYTNGKYLKMDKLKSYRGFETITLIFMMNDEKKKIACADIWGFSLNKRLFRVDHQDEHPVALVDSGKMCYYENGASYINQFLWEAEYITNSNTGTTVAIGNVAYLSGTLNSDIVPMPCAVTLADLTYLSASGGKKKYEGFKKDWPAHQPFYECLDNTKTFSLSGNYSLSGIRDCIVNYIGYPKNDSIPNYEK